jgi:hypothetical protein
MNVCVVINNICRHFDYTIIVSLSNRKKSKDNSENSSYNLSEQAIQHIHIVVFSWGKKTA